MEKLSKRDAIKWAAVAAIAKDWRDYGTPNRSQAAKIAAEAIEEWERRNGRAVGDSIS